MKKLILSLCFPLFIGASYSQCPVKYPNEITFGLTGGGADYRGYNLRMFGEDSEKLKDAIISNYPKVKLYGSRYKIKDAVIPGIEKPVNIEVYQGVHEKTDNGSTFHSFKNLEEKNDFLTMKNDNQSLSVNVYFRHKRRNTFKTIEEAKIAKEYFESLYQD